MSNEIAEVTEMGQGMGQGIGQSQGAVTQQAGAATGNAAAAAPGPAATAQAAASAPEAQPLMPSTSAIIQSGAFGAVLGGISTGVMEMARVKKGEATTEEAVKNVASASAQGAATMAVATIASHMVRARPLFGFLALAAAGLGAFLILNNSTGKAAKGARKAPAAAKAVKDASATV